MHSVLVRQADDLRPETRAALGVEIGRPFQDNERVVILAFPAQDALTDREHQAMIHRLEERFKQADERTKDIPEGEWDEILLEAMRSVRPGYQERR
jgi:hypothetical protein